MFGKLSVGPVPTDLTFSANSYSGYNGCYGRSKGWTNGANDDVAARSTVNPILCRVFQIERVIEPRLPDFANFGLRPLAKEDTSRLSNKTHVPWMRMQLTSPPVTEVYCHYAKLVRVGDGRQCRVLGLKFDNPFLISNTDGVTVGQLVEAMSQHGPDKQWMSDSLWTSGADTWDTQELLLEQKEMADRKFYSEQAISSSIRCRACGL